MGVRSRDRWLFLTPEAELPAAVAALRAARGEPGGDAAADGEQRRVAALLRATPGAAAR
jgi:hypothetical protein